MSEKFRPWSNGEAPKAPRQEQIPEPEKEEMSDGRRRFLFGAASAGLVGALGLTAYGIKKSSEDSETISSKESGTHAPAPVHRGAFPTGEIAGRPVADLFAFYLGVPEHHKIPESIDPDFGTIMYHLWQKKLARVHRIHPDWMHNAKQAEQHFGERYIQAWKEGDLTQQTLPELVRDAGEVVEKTRENFHWEHFDENHRYGQLFGPEEADLVHKLSRNITPEMLIAYSVTELMPFEGDTDPELRRMPLEVYETLLARAGREFLVDLPAINDPYLSTGMFQFTSFALYDDGHEKRGASKLNKLIHDPANRLPGSVLKLDTAQKQIQAAYMFSLDNLAMLVQHIANDPDHHRAKKRMHMLTTKSESLHVELLQYIASAHHNPSDARQAFEKWIDKDFEGSHAELCSPRIRNYVRSAHINYEELKRKL